MTKTVNVFIKSDPLDFDFVGNTHREVHLTTILNAAFFPVQLSQKDLLMIKSEPEGSRSPVHTKFEMQLRPVTSAADQAVLFSSAFYGHVCSKKPFIYFGVVIGNEVGLSLHDILIYELLVTTKLE